MFKNKKRVEELERHINIIRNTLDDFGQPGNYNKNEYSTGVYNGIEYALSILDEREAKIVSTEWLNYKGRCRKISAKDLIKEREGE